MSNKWVHIYTASGEPEANIVVSLLKSEGIDVKVSQESLGKLYSLTIDGLGEVRIFVQEDESEMAKEILEAKLVNEE